MATEPIEHKGRFQQYLDIVTGSLEQKKRYREYKARMKKLPASYRAAVEALDRYLMYAGGITNGDTLTSMMEDLANLFEQSAANGTPIRAVVGDDPVEFIETFLQNYSEGLWINKERERLTRAIARAAGEDSGKEASAV